MNKQQRMQQREARRGLPVEEGRLAEAIVAQLNAATGQGYRILSFEVGRMRGGRGGTRTFDCSLWVKDAQNEPVHLTYIGESGAMDAGTQPMPERELVSPAAGPAVLELPEYQIRLWAYPNDPGLPGVALLESPEQLTLRLEQNPQWLGLHEAPVELSDIWVRRVKYVARIRASFLVTCRCRRLPSQSGPDAASAFAKVVKAVGVETRFANLLAFEKKVKSQPGCGVFIPDIYGIDVENGVLWQQALSGQPVADSANGDGLLLHLAPEIGSRLAAFHNLDVSLSPGYNAAHQVEEIKKTCQAMDRAQIARSSPLYRLAGALLERSREMREVPPRPVHGSFKLSHVFQTSEGLYFIDCETVSAGDPAYDLGRFAAHLYKMALQGSVSMNEVQRIIDRFNAAYLEAIQFTLQMERIVWHTVAHLVASQGLKQLKRGRSRLLPELAALGQQLLART